MTLYECHCVIVTLFANSIALRGWLEGLVLLGLRGVLRAIALLLHFSRILLRYYYTFWEGRDVRGSFTNSVRQRWEHRDTRRPTEEHRGVHNAGKRRLFRRFAKKTFGNTDSCRFLACLRTLF